MHGHVRRTLAGVRRTNGVAPKQALPLCTEDVARLVAATSDALFGLRDRAFVLVGFVGAFRVGELVGLDTTDLEAHPQGVVVRVRRAKTDQEGRPDQADPSRHRAREFCPVRTLQAWQRVAGIDSGPVWQGDTRAGSVRDGRLSTRDEP